MDLLIPGIYVWLDPLKIATAGHNPESEYRDVSENKLHHLGEVYAEQ